MSDQSNIERTPAGDLVEALKALKLARSLIIDYSVAFSNSHQAKIENGVTEINRILDKYPNLK